MTYSVVELEGCRNDAGSGSEKKRKKGRRGSKRDYGGEVREISIHQVYHCRQPGIYLFQDKHYQRLILFTISSLSQMSLINKMPILSTNI